MSFRRSFRIEIKLQIDKSCSPALKEEDSKEF